jgi:2C-methyl-D-erythritol 2,4-cyclodiphosphate synthase
VPYRHVSGKTPEPLFTEDVGNKAHGFFDEKLSPVRGADSRALLPSMLQCIEPEIGEVGSLRMTIDAEYPALFVDIVEHRFFIVTYHEASKIKQKKSFDVRVLI